MIGVVGGSQWAVNHRSASKQEGAKKNNWKMTLLPELLVVLSQFKIKVMYFQVALFACCH